MDEMINVMKTFVDQLSEAEQIMLWSPMAPMFVKIETHKTIKDSSANYGTYYNNSLKNNE